MATTFCESNAGSQYPHGGIPLNDETELKNGLCRWETAFSSGDLNPGLHTLFFDFDKDLLNDLMSDTACKGLRIFPVLDENGKINVMIVPKDEDRNEIIVDSKTGVLKACCCGQNGRSSFFDEKVNGKCE